MLDIRYEIIDVRYEIMDVSYEILDIRICSMGDNKKNALVLTNAF